MIFNYIKLTFSQLNLNINEVFNLLKSGEFTKENPLYTEVIKVFEELPELCEISGGYAIFDNIEIKNAEGKILLNGIEIFPQSRICNYLKNSEKIAVFICSAGDKFSILSKKANADGDYLKGYIIDTLGSITAEHTANFIQKEIQSAVKKDALKITNRYSPGYCNWNLSNQKELFSLLPENTCNISLTDSCLMLPIKSVSGIIGIGKNVRHYDYKCLTCNDKNCIYRRFLFPC